MKLSANRSGFLNSICILDLADEKASFCTKLLADLGARVIKVEKAGGDASRKRGPFRESTSQSQTSLSFFYNNTNKLGITLDLEHKEGKSIFLKLVRKADVLVETFSPGFLRRIGLDFETLSSVNSKLIYVSVTGFGQSGPRRDYKVCDLVACAYGGQMFVSGSPSAPPLKAFGNQSYYAASLFAATGVLLALMNRIKTGSGEHFNISLQESVTATLEHVMVRFFAEGVVHSRHKSLHWNESFVVLPCKNGFIHVSLFQHWETLIDWLDSEAMAEDLKDIKWLDEDYRHKHIDHVIEVLGRWTKTHKINEIFELAQLMRFPWAPIQSPIEILKSPHLKARNFFVKTDDPKSAIPLKYPGAPYKFRNGLIPEKNPAPSAGEHNMMIYHREMGISEEKLKQLSSQNVI